ncbi:MAG: TatD family hydrolase [Clostridia bacterium]|nr:TatD family hydrolase [Clostridia bacterium]
MLFDTHTHLQEDAFREDIPEILMRMQEQDVQEAMVVGTDLDTSLRALQLSGRFSNLYAAIGIHPHEAGKATEEDFSRLQDMLSDPKVKAWGEIGLDYYYDFSDRPTQKEWFEKQLVFAYEKDIPVILHIRDAHGDTVDLLKSLHGQVPSCVVHCCSASREIAKIYLDMGFMLSFTGMLTFKNAKGPRETCAFTPSDRLMVETDCPYMTPVPYRGKRNEPAYVSYVLTAMAEIKETDREEFAGIVLANSHSFFRIT